MKKTEQKLTSKLIHYLKSDECPFHTGAIEVKAFRGRKSIPLREIYPHQIRNLKIVAHKKLVHKISDAGAFCTPFDIFMLKNELAYFVFIDKAVAHFIHIDDFIVGVDKLKRKSLTLKDVQNMAIFSEKLR